MLNISTVNLLPQQSEIFQLHKTSIMMKSKCKCLVAAMRYKVLGVGK